MYGNVAIHSIILLKSTWALGREFMTVAGGRAWKRALARSSCKGRRARRWQAASTVVTTPAQSSCRFAAAAYLLETGSLMRYGVLSPFSLANRQAGRCVLTFACLAGTDDLHKSRHVLRVQNIFAEVAR